MGPRGNGKSSRRLILLRRDLSKGPKKHVPTSGPTPVGPFFSLYAAVCSRLADNYAVDE